MPHIPRRSVIFAVALAVCCFGLGYAVAHNGHDDGGPMESGVMSRDEARVIEDRWGEMRIFQTGQTYATENMFTAIATVKPGESVHPAHRHAGEEFLVLTEGSGHWHLEGKEFEAKPGDVMYIEPWRMHGLVNTGEKPLRFFVIKYTGKGVAPPPEPEGSHGR